MANLLVYTDQVKDSLNILFRGHTVVMMSGPDNIETTTAAFGAVAELRADWKFYRVTLPMLPSIFYFSIILIINDSRGK